MRQSPRVSKFPLLGLLAAAALVAGGGSAVLGVCGPFTDVTDAGFCPFVLEVFTLGITTGTTPTTYDPSSNVTRLQMAAFLSRTVDAALKRGSRPAALQRFWTTTTAGAQTVTLPGNGLYVEYDGADLWVSQTDGHVTRVRANDGKIVENWAGASSPGDLLPAMGRIFVAGGTTPGQLYQIDPSQSAISVNTVASTLGDGAFGIAFDGARVWTANTGSVSILTPGAPWTVTTVTAGFQTPQGILYDGTNIWVTDVRVVGIVVHGVLLRLDGSGGVLQTVTGGNFAGSMVFDGSNIWFGNRVVRASTGAVLATLTLGGGNAFAYDGQTVLIGGSLYKAASATYAGPAVAGGFACSDGMSFWVAVPGTNSLVRF